MREPDAPRAARPARPCLVPGCGHPAAYDGLCLPEHLWAAEHHSAYLGGPHHAPVPDCPLCAAGAPVDPGWSA